MVRNQVNSKEQLGRIDLNLIFTFDALLRYKSVTRAAVSLSLTQSAVSHALKRLRTLFDDPLFKRSSAGVVPTPRALALATTIAEVADLIRKGLLNETPFEPSAAGRTFVVCMGDLGELTILPTLVAALRRSSPFSTIRAVHTQPEATHAMLESGEADLSISGLLPGNAEIYRQKLFSAKVIVLANQKLVPKKNISLEEYCNLPHVAVVPVWGTKSLVDQGLERIGRKRQVMVTTQHYLTIPHLLEGNPWLIATVPRDMAAAWQRHGDLRIYDLPFRLPAYEVSQYWHGRFHTDRTHVWFRNLVASCFQGRSAS